MKFIDLKDEHLVELAKMRYENDRSEYSGTLLEITVYDKTTTNKKTELHGVRFLVKTEEYQEDYLSILFYRARFYPNEFLYLQDIGIKF